MALPRFCSSCAAPLPHPPPVICRSCDTSHWLDAKPCAGALVTRRGKLMLVRRAHEPWRGLPGTCPAASAGRASTRRTRPRARCARRPGSSRARRGRPRDVDRHLRARGSRRRQGDAQHLLPRDAEGSAEARDRPERGGGDRLVRARRPARRRSRSPATCPPSSARGARALEPGHGRPRRRCARQPTAPHAREPTGLGRGTAKPRDRAAPSPTSARSSTSCAATATSSSSSAGRRAARGGRDPPPRDRRRRAGAALHATCAAPTSRSSRTSSAPRAAPSWRSADGRARLIRRLVAARRDAPAADAGEALGRARRGARGCCASASRRARAGPVTEVVTDDVRLDRLPALTCWPEDGGPFVTLPLVYTEHPDAPGRTTSACTACRCTTRARPACTGRSARAAASTTRSPRRAARRCR